MTELLARQGQAGQDGFFRAKVALRATVADGITGRAVQAMLGPDVVVIGRLRHQLCVQRPKVGFNGPFVLRAHLKTGRDGRLARTLDVTGVAPIEGELAVGGNFDVSGKVVRLDRAEALATLRIFPQREHVEPFTVSFAATLDQLSAVEDERFVRATGRVTPSGRLVAETIERAELVIPEHLKGWKPAWKNKPIREACDGATEGAGS